MSQKQPLSYKILACLGTRVFASGMDKQKKAGSSSELPAFLYIYNRCVGWFPRAAEKTG